MLGIACWLIGRRIPLRRIDFSCPAPEHRADYHQFFGAPVHFSQPQSRLAFDARYLALPTIRSEPALRQFLREFGLWLPPAEEVKPEHLRDLLARDLADNPIAVADHCYACTAGQGSSCGGALAA